MTTAWEARLSRARHLAASPPHTSGIVPFYVEVLRFQAEVYARLQRELPASIPEVPQPLRDRLDPLHLIDEVPRMLAFVQAAGSPALKEASTALMRASGAAWMALLTSESGLSGTSGTLEAVDQSAEHRFFALTLLQPYAELLAARMSVADASQPEAEAVGRCPCCDGLAVAGVLRESGHGGARSLLCSFCATEWPAPRGRCAACGETRVEQLPVFEVEQYAHVRVDACDTCRRYVKTIDLTVCGVAVPVVDEAATVPVDFWAADQGYTKITPNLFGI
jgi:FdhE protein